MKVIIKPTPETDWGIEDTYHIVSDKKEILHEYVPYELLTSIIKHHNYEVVGGEKYL